MRRAVKAHGSDAPPLASDLASGRYPTEGDAAANPPEPATILGAYWFHLVQEAIVQTIELAGLVPNDDPAQFKDALARYITQQIGEIPEGITLADISEHTQPNPPDDEAATPAGVRAAVNQVKDQIIGGAPEALDTLNELAAALGDDADFRATITNGLAGKANKNNANLTGTPRAPTPPAGDSSTRIATTAWLTSFFGDASSREFTAAGVTNYRWEWGATKCLAIIDGAGGGGGAHTSGSGTVYGGGGGGGAGDRRVVIISGLSLDDVLTVSVGAGGAGGKSNVRLPSVGGDGGGGAPPRDSGGHGGQDSTVTVNGVTYAAGGGSGGGAGSRGGGRSANGIRKFGESILSALGADGGGGSAGRNVNENGFRGSDSSAGTGGAGGDRVNAPSVAGAVASGGGGGRINVNSNGASGGNGRVTLYPIF